MYRLYIPLPEEFAANKRLSSLFRSFRRHVSLLHTFQDGGVSPSATPFFSNRASSRDLSANESIEAPLDRFLLPFSSPLPNCKLYKLLSKNIARKKTNPDRKKFLKRGGGHPP